MILFLSSFYRWIKNKIYSYRVLPNFWENTTALKLAQYDIFILLCNDMKSHRIKIHTYQKGFNK